jgi:hypothetical protein
MEQEWAIVDIIQPHESFAIAGYYQCLGEIIRNVTIVKVDKVTLLSMRT